MLIEEVKGALPDIKIMIMEPFVLKACATEEKWDCFNSEVKKRAEMAQKIAQKYDLPYIELQEGFDELSKNIENSYWLSDGVHPTAMGHEYIKGEWLKAFNLMKKLKALVTAEVVSTFAHTFGVEGGNFGISSAAEMLNNVVGMLLVIGANTIARKASDVSLY